MERKLIGGVLCYVCSAGKQAMIYRTHSKKDIHYQKWVAPGGGLEEGESLAQCAEREVLEELGIKIKPLRRGRVFFNNLKRTFNGRDADFDYECIVYSAITAEKPKDRTDKGDNVELFDSEKMLFLPQHECDRYIWVLLQQERQFDAQFRYSGENMSGFDVGFE